MSLKWTVHSTYTILIQSFVQSKSVKWWQLTGWPDSPSSPFSPDSPSVPCKQEICWLDNTCHLKYLFYTTIRFNLWIYGNIASRFHTYSNTWLSRRARVSRESNRTLLRERNKMHQCSKRHVRRHCWDIISLDTGIKDMLRNLDSDLVLVYLVTAIEGNLLDLMMMLQIHEKMPHCIPLPCRHKI